MCVDMEVKGRAWRVTSLSRPLEGRAMGSHLLKETPGGQGCDWWHCAPFTDLRKVRTTGGSLAQGRSQRW